MGEGDKRYSKRTTRYEGGRLGVVMLHPAREAPSEPKDDHKAGGGTPKLAGPALARTTTLDDPLTTSVLAEISRRSLTLEVTPEQIKEARDLEVADLAGAPARHARR